MGRRGVGKISSTALLAALTASCATTEYVPVAPDCACPPEPALDDVPREALLCVPDDAYWALEERDTRIRNYVEELQAICRETCGPPATPP